MLYKENKKWALYMSSGRLLVTFAYEKRMVHNTEEKYIIVIFWRVWVKRNNIYNCKKEVIEVAIEDKMSGIMLSK